jgi:[ribosomal protein S5]-alanine N-acetyltransferase
MTAIDALQTERLIAEPIASRHLAKLCRMHRDARVMATLGGCRSDEVSARFLDKSIEHWQAHGYGLWMIYDRATGGFVGRAGLRQVEIADRLEVELAYALMAEFWGCGLATELGRAVLDLGQARLGLADIVAFTLVTNRASQNVMKKLGMRYERNFMHENEPHMLYRTVR